MPRKKTEQPEATVTSEETTAAQEESVDRAAPPETETPDAETPPAPVADQQSEQNPGQSDAQTSEPSQQDLLPDEDTQAASEQPEGQESKQDAPPPEPAPKKKHKVPSRKTAEDTPPAENTEPADEAPVPKTSQPPRRRSEPSILTIASGDEVETPDEQEETAWHEVRNAYRTRRILTGTLSGVEPTETGKPVVIVNYKEYRVVIPMSEMMISLSQGENHYGEMQIRQSKILGNMIGAEIDFVVKGIENKSRSVVASRKDAIMRKRKLFYFDTDAGGMYRVYEGRIVQARVIAVAEKVVRVEAFGVECSILARDLSYDWLGDAREHYHIGDEILIRIQQVNRESLETLSIRADVKSVTGDTGRDNLKKCRIQGKYAGTVTDIHKGVVFVRLNIGVNAVAHSCYDARLPGKKDEVSFAVTHLDEEKNVAVGIITRIMRRNI